MKKLSIIIPTYNRPQMLKRALHSIQTENKDNIEVIVCDDKSSEFNIELNKEIIKEVSMQVGIEIIYLENNRTKGVSGARNCAIEHSNAEWLMFLDDDDEFTENYIDNILTFINENIDVDILWSNVIILKKINGKDVRIKKYFTPKNKDELYKDFVSIGLGYGVAIRKSAIQDCGLFNENLLVSEDTDLFFKFIAKNKRIINISEFGVILHDHDCEKLTRNYEYHAQNHIFKKLYRQNYKYIKRYDLLYISFSSWIVNVYKQAGMKKEAILFCFEFWLKKMLSISVLKQFIYEIKNLRWR